MSRIQYFDWGSIEWIYEPDSNNYNGKMYIGISTILPGKRQHEHIHYGDEQLLYVLSGYGRQLIDNKLSIKEPGALFHIEPGSVHESINTGNEPIRELLISIPAYDRQISYTNESLNVENTVLDDFDDKLVLTDEIKNLYDETAKTLKIPISIFNKLNEAVIAANNFPRFCMEKCKVHENINNCRLYNIKDEYKQPYYKDPSAFVCQYGLRVFVMPIIIDNKLIGTIKGGHIRIYENDIKERKFNSDLDKKLYENMQIIHQGRLMAILGYIKTLSKNISYYYVLANTEIELNKKEEIIREISKNKSLLESNLKSIKEEVLNTQINNHFLFNTLNAIASLAVKDGSMKTYESIVRLSDIFRYLLKPKDSNVTLEEEIQLVENYLELQKLRYEDKLDIDIMVSEEVQPVKVPYNFIQPIVENSFTHGFKNKLDNFKVCISCKSIADKVYIEIGDNGIGMEKGEVLEIIKRIKKDSKSGRLSGLSMAYRKLELSYGDKFKFEIMSKKFKGTKIIISMPFTKEEL